MIGSSQWRSVPGSYILVLELERPGSVDVGRLGRRCFGTGRYVYVGSALGPGGVAGRLERHLRADKRIHWHVDYLAGIARITGVSAVYGPTRQECRWARALAVLAGAFAPVTGFGSSDCRTGCRAHLWRLPDALPLSWIEDELTRCPIQTI